MSVWYVLGFATLAAAHLALAYLAGSLPWRVLLVDVALSWALVAVAYAGAGPRVLMKRPDGTFPVWSWLLHWPYLLLFRACFEAGRLLRGNPPWHEIVPGLYLGRRLTRREAADAVLRLHIHAVLDLTSALAEPPAMRSAGAYRLLPVLDNTSPTLAELRDAAAWIARHLAAGSVYVHCAAGHGRAAAVVAAYLLSAGRAANAEDALALIRSRRPGVRLLPRQARTLRQFAVEAIRAGGGQGR